ncbi:uncharacterized protein LAJ45_07630 [Morchella importuna]|uniref:uncharacterized protein n=1 Tax=Morchella importuna TaxID=1174673 RepID=UPI001E8E639A|nr:uncharacterized protein LAJ45_07630 [Morchella importuna]KAH8148178.1 hypothetical protein LAJ45_07630 [Morchella importuna]
MEGLSSQELQDDDFDSKEHQACYVYTPEDRDDRPTKRRRTVKGKTKQTETESVQEPSNKCPFPVLLNGEEKEETVKLRYETYCRLWGEQQERTNAILQSFNNKTLEDVSGFVKSPTAESCDGKIPTALILTGPNIASHTPLFEQLASRIRDEEKIGPVVILTSKDATNLKSILKKLIRDATQQDEGIDDEEEEIVGRKGSKLLNYDLQILQNWCKLHEGQKVVIAIQDTEAFDGTILSDLVSLFSAYMDRIPFTLLMGIATSVEIFHEKLPKSTIRLMKGDKFDVERAEECLAQIFNDSMIGENPILRLGPTVCDFLLARYRDHNQSIQAFVGALKYAYMSHFYANPLSIILAFMDNLDSLGEVLTPLHIEAIRNVPSFKRYVEQKLNNRDATEVRKLLGDNDHVRSTVIASAAGCRSYAVCVGQALTVLEIARSCQMNQNRIPRYELYAQVLSGELHSGTTLVRDLLLSMKKMNSTSLLNLLDKVTEEVQVPYLVENVAPLRERIIALVEAAESSGKKTLNSEFNVTKDSLRATAVSKRIQLGEQKSALTKEDTEYSKLVQQVHDVAESYFKEHLKGLQGLFLHELFFYDLISPHRDVFAPRSRSTVERALSAPQDYLGCECCTDESGEEVGIKATQPPASIIYQLYLESGALINIFDLWRAFYQVIGGDEGEDCDEATAQALFYRALAEMRFLGLVKHTKKKADHLAKLAWKGL